MHLERKRKDMFLVTSAVLHRRRDFFQIENKQGNFNLTCFHSLAAWIWELSSQKPCPSSEFSETAEGSFNSVKRFSFKNKQTSALL